MGVAQSWTSLPTLKLGRKDRQVLARCFILLLAVLWAVHTVLWASLCLRASSWALSLGGKGQADGSREETNNKSGLNANEQ